MEASVSVAASDVPSITFQAKYSGECIVCGGAIAKGEVVAIARKNTPRMHVGCWSNRANRAAASVATASEPETQATGDNVVEMTPDSAPFDLTHPAPVVDIEALRNELMSGFLKWTETRLLPEIEKQLKETERAAGNTVASFRTEIREILAAETKSARAMVEAEMEKNVARIGAAVAPVIEAKVEKAIRDRDGLLIKVERPDAEPKKIQNAHCQLPQLLSLIELRDHVYLYGPAGSGKSTAAQHAAEALGLKYGYVSLDPQSPRSLIFGFIDASGRYVSTKFRELYETGGVFCFDEMDNSSANLLNALNSALENGWCAFPDGMVARHPDFVVVGTGNTTGRGGDVRFMSRRQFDAAFGDRFSFVAWEYDMDMERRAALNFNADAAPWITWVQKVREYVDKAKVNVIVTPRASIKGARLLKKGGFRLYQIAEMTIFKGLEVETVKRVIGAVPLPTIKGVGA